MMLTMYLEGKFYTHVKINDVAIRTNILFQGIRKIPDYKVHLHIDKTVQPTIQKARRIPFTMRDKLSKELRISIIRY